MSLKTVHPNDIEFFSYDIAETLDKQYVFDDYRSYVEFGHLIINFPWPTHSTLGPTLAWHAWSPLGHMPLTVSSPLILKMISQIPFFVNIFSNFIF